MLTTAFAVQVASAEGMLYALTVPHLRLLSRTGVFPGSPTSLLCSPDCQWVFASTQDSDLGPKVSGGAAPSPLGSWLCAYKVVGSVPMFVDVSGKVTSSNGPRLPAAPADRMVRGQRSHQEQTSSGEDRNPEQDIGDKSTPVTYTAQNSKSP